MGNRSKRIESLRIILSTKAIGSHEEILKELEKYGWKITQASLSRDLTKLHAAKILDENGYRYILPDNPLYRRTISPEIFPAYLRNSGFLSISYSGNIAVLHTRPGYAGSLAADIDAHKLRTVDGTIAGDDTIFIVMNENVERQTFIDELATLIPAIKSVGE